MGNSRSNYERHKDDEQYYHHHQQQRRQATTIDKEFRIILGQPDLSYILTKLKKNLSNIEEKLDDAYDEFEDQLKLKSHLGMMEARERIEKLEDVAYEFTSKVASNAQEELDIVKLRAHLLKMESDDLMEEKQKELSAVYERSKEEAEELSIKAAKEFNQIVLKLTDIV